MGSRQMKRKEIAFSQRIHISSIQVFFTREWWEQGKFPIYWDPNLICTTCLCSSFRAWRLLAPRVQQKEPKNTFLKMEKLTQKQTRLCTIAFVKVSHHFSLTLKWCALSITGSAPLPFEKSTKGSKNNFVYILLKESARISFYCTWQMIIH